MSGKGDKPGGSGKQSKFKGPNPSKIQSTQTDKGKGKEASNLEYDALFIGKIKEKFYNQVWVKNGAVIEWEFDLNSFEELGFRYLQNFTNRGWLNLANFKAESILTLC